MMKLYLLSSDIITKLFTYKSKLIFTIKEQKDSNLSILSDK
jgi:hypothetical protein